MTTHSQKLTLEQISKDMHALSDQFAQHSADDRLFQEETRNTDMNIHDTLLRIEGRIGGIEKKMDPEHDDYILREINKKVDILMELYDGVGFSVRALKYVSGALLSLSLLVGVVFAFIKYAAK